MIANEFYQLARSRRSIRKYTNQTVPKEMIQRVLAAAIEAPSGKNRQNWRFVVVSGNKRDQYLEHSQQAWGKIKDILKNKLKPSLYDFTERFFYTLGGAPIVVFCYSYNSPDEKHLTSVGSVYMAIQNILLAATAQGLGTCTMGAPLEIKEDVNNFLGMNRIKEFADGNLELLCGITIGFPDHEPPRAPRDLESKIIWIQEQPFSGCFDKQGPL